MILVQVFQRYCSRTASIIAPDRFFVLAVRIEHISNATIGRKVLVGVLVVYGVCFCQQELTTSIRQWEAAEVNVNRHEEVILQFTLSDRILPLDESLYHSGPLPP